MKMIITQALFTFKECNLGNRYSKGDHKLRSVNFCEPINVLRIRLPVLKYGHIGVGAWYGGSALFTSTEAKEDSEIPWNAYSNVIKAIGKSFPLS